MSMLQLNLWISPVSKPEILFSNKIPGLAIDNNNKPYIVSM